MTEHSEQHHEVVELFDIQGVAEKKKSRELEANDVYSWAREAVGGGMVGQGSRWRWMVGHLGNNIGVAWQEEGKEESEDIKRNNIVFDL